MPAADASLKKHDSTERYGRGKDMPRERARVREKERGAETEREKLRVLYVRLLWVPPLTTVGRPTNAGGRNDNP